MLAAIHRQCEGLCLSAPTHLTKRIGAWMRRALKNPNPRSQRVSWLVLLALTGLLLFAATAPSITTQPASQTVTLGTKATFSVVASGTAPLTYQWSKNGTAITGATAASYTTPATVSTDSGSTFSVKVKNLAGTKTSNSAPLTVNLPPTISTQPASKSVVLGSTASFTVVASGTGTLGYQWSRNGTTISGATAATYTTAATVAGDNGATFTVKVTNTYGNVTSAAATLTLNLPPSITTQPVSKTVNLGAAATFSVAATGTGALTYQWSKNGSVISGATAATYTTPVTAVVDNGATFTAKVTNSVGTVTSSAATLTLNLPPTITSFTPISGGVGTSVALTGTNYTGVTAVKFNGIAASSYTVGGATSITVVAPNGVTTGKLSVTTASGTATSSASFPPPRYFLGHPIGDNPLRGAHEEEGRVPAVRGSRRRP